MFEVPEILSLFNNETAETMWKPLLSQFPGQSLTVSNPADGTSHRRLFHGRCDPAIILLSTELYESCGTELLDKLRRHYPQTKIILFASSNAHPMSLRSLISNRIHHLVVLDPAKDSGKFQWLINTIAANGVWDIHASMGTEAVIREFQMTDHCKKEFIIDQIEKMIEGSASDLYILKQKSALLADELIENALHAAPAIAAPIKDIIVQAGFDGERLALQVIDFWGTLTPETALEYMAQHQEGAVGAYHPGGRGLFILWQFFDHFHIHINDGVTTSVGGYVNRYSDRIAEQTRGFGIFHTPRSCRSRSKDQGRFDRRMANYA